MAQPSSIQREPTMEEILASIRRIIEDGDTAAPAEKRPAQAEPDAEPHDVANDHDIPIVEAFREEVKAEAPEVETPAPNAATPKSMADLQASLQQERREPEPSSLLDVPVAEPAEAVELRADEARAEEARTEAAPEAPDTDDDLAPSTDLEPWRADTASDDSEPRHAIISEKAGRQVAAAFEELSEAFAASRQRSFDEMAEELLRPMLREWMDNNLPVLVERLVREEIERVARGA